MLAITVLKFNTDNGADKSLGILQDLAEQQLIVLHGLAIATWPTGRNNPKIKQITDLTGTDALDDAFWRLFFSLIFSAPLFGTGMAGSLTNMGIDDNFIKSVRKKVTEGTSALFLVTSDRVLDSVPGAMKNIDFELISSGLSKEQDERLRTAFVHK